MTEHRSTVSRTALATLTIALAQTIAAEAAAEPAILSNGRLHLRLSEKLGGGIVELRDTESGVVTNAEADARLYEVAFGRDPDELLTITNKDATQSSLDVDRAARKLTVTNQHGGATQCTVVLTIELDPSLPRFRARIEVQNDGKLSLRSITFPCAPVARALGGPSRAPDLIVPRGEGLLFPSAGFAFSKGYRISSPGGASMQFVAVCGESAGIMVRSEDAEGWRKVIAALPSEDGQHCYLAVKHLTPYLPGQGCRVPYSVVVATFDGGWQGSVEEYKTWAHQQPWCRRRIHERNDFPGVLKVGAVGVSIKDRKSGPPLGDYTLMADRFHGLLGTDQIPIFFRPYDWASAAEWWGPEYFPVIGGNEQFTNDCAAIAEHRAVVYPFMNAETWLYATEYRKSETQRRAWHQRDRYDGWSLFETHGLPYVAVTRERFSAEEPFKRSPRGKALMCLACKPYQDRVVDNYVQIVRLGAMGCHFDGCIGGASEVCWSDRHGHPPGPGSWTMRGYLDVMRRVRETCQSIRPGAVFGTEEPGELAIQHVHMYHAAPGSAMTAFPYAWSCQVLHARPVPLYVSVYHPWQVSLDRWPFLLRDSDYRRHSMALALVWGKQINCHFVRAELPKEPAGLARLFREAARMRALIAPDLLVMGEMLDEAQVECGRVSLTVKRSQPRGKARGEATWTEPGVRAWWWQAPGGRIGCVAVNWTLKAQSFELTVPKVGSRARAAVLRKSDDGDSVLTAQTALPFVVKDTLSACCSALYELR